MSDEVKRFWYAGRSGRQYGMGLKQARKGSHQLALKHFFLALKFDEASRQYRGERDPVVLESIARSYANLNEYDQARKYAKESLSGFRKRQDLKNPRTITLEAVKRVEKLIEDISRMHEV